MGLFKNKKLKLDTITPEGDAETSDNRGDDD